MVELNIEGKRLQLSLNEKIQYNIQISDIFDIASVSSSYTDSFSVPKTPENTQIFEQLGISGDNSTIPYRRVPANLKNEGFDVIVKGWLNVKETSGAYQVSIIDGMIDFFKAIDNATLGTDLDLTEFNHEKNLDTVIDSMAFDSLNMKYIVADYNGKNIGLVGSISGINIDYLIPCFRVGRIFDIIFQTYGYTYTPSEINFINDLYITYPLPPASGSVAVLIATLNKGNFNSSSFGVKYKRAYIPSQTFWSSNTIDTDFVALQNNWLMQIQQQGTYSIVVNTMAYSKWTLGEIRNVLVSVYKNGSIIGSVATEGSETTTDLEIQFNANEGDIIEYFLSIRNDTGIREIRHNSTVVKLYRLTLGNVSVTDAFKDFKIKDFFKEILWRTGLTPVINPLNNHISFVTLDSRLDFSNAIDWTSKYVDRTLETYLLDGYTQKNNFTLMHNSEGDTYGNGALYVNNENIDDEQNIVESKIYAPELFNYEFKPIGATSGFTTNKYRLWDRESKQNDDTGTIEIDYKTLSSRFYFLRFKRYGARTWNFVSEALNQTRTVPINLPYAVNNETLFDELIYKNYVDYQFILTNFKAHNISLKLALSDVLNLNMLVPYYFKQEAQYYVLNKLTYQSGDISTGEFLRINNLTTN